MMQIRFELSESKELHGIQIRQNHKEKSIIFSRKEITLSFVNMAFHKCVNEY